LVTQAAGGAGTAQMIVSLLDQFHADDIGARARHEPAVD
jgi:hypothetical protein